MSDDIEEQDNYPFDRPHWNVSVSFPMSRLPEKDELLKKVEEFASWSGGRVEMYCVPVEGYVDQGFGTFGVSVAYEAGDANTHGFIRRCEKELGATIEFDPELVSGPDEDLVQPRRRF